MFCNLKSISSRHLVVMQRFRQERVRLRDVEEKDYIHTGHTKTTLELKLKPCCIVIVIFHFSVPHLWRRNKIELAAIETSKAHNDNYYSKETISGF